MVKSWAMGVNDTTADFGERQARTQLEQALSGHGVQFQGTADQKLDLIVQFHGPDPARSLLYLGVQVKTGWSYVRHVGPHRIFLKANPEDLKVWKRSNLPVALIWVNPDTAECHWTQITDKTQPQYLSVSRRAKVSPALAYEFAARLISLRPTSEDGRVTSLHSGLSFGLRQVAKNYYRNALLGKKLAHPILGDVSVSWRGWRHLTRAGRSKSFIAQSLLLLPSVKWVSEHPTVFRGVRRLPPTSRGEWTTERRLFLFDTTRVVLPGSTPRTIRTVFRERVSFPTDWLTRARYHLDVRREAAFESVYEKKEQERDPTRR